MQSCIKIDSKVILKRRQASDLSYGPLNSIRRSYGRLGSTLIPKKSCSKDPRHEGKTAFSSLHTSQHCSGSSKLNFFLSVSNTSQKITPTVNLSFHRHQSTKGTLWTCWLFSQKLVRTFRNREDTDGLCTFSGSWLSHKHTSWACCGGVTQSN